MAIVGTFQADFSQFNSAVNAATANLRHIEGGTARLTQAFDSMDADRHFVTLNKVTTQSTNVFGEFRTSLSQADRTLAQFGVNLTPQVAALNEMSRAAGQTVTQLGLVTTGLLAGSAAMAGWQFGRFIAGVTGSDKVIGDFVASLAGFNAKVEIAAHQQDVMARASKAAGFEVTSFEAAVKILGDASDALAEKMGSAPELFARVRSEVAAAQRDFRGLSESQRENITFLLEHGQKAGDLEKAFRLHAGTVDVLIGRNRLLAEQDKVNLGLTKERTTAQHELTKAMTTYEQGLTKEGFLRSTQFTPEITTGPTAGASHSADVERAHGQAEEAQAYADAQAEANRMAAEGVLVVGEYANANKQAGEAAKAATQEAVYGYAAVSQQVALSGDAIRAWIELQKYSAAANAILKEGPLFMPTSSSQLRRISELPQGSGGGITVNINASNSFLNTPADTQRLAETVGRSVTAQLAGNGRQV